MATKQIAIKVTKNNHGNFRGFVTGKDSVQLGDNDFLAKEWLKEQLEKNPGAKFDAAKSAAEVGGY
jgi:hypothetical protein